jgi:hypothetical protein
MASMSVICKSTTTITYQKANEMFLVVECLSFLSADQPRFIDVQELDDRTSDTLSQTHASPAGFTRAL